MFLEGYPELNLHLLLLLGGGITDNPGYGKIRATFFMLFMVVPTETLDKNTMYHK